MPPNLVIGNVSEMSCILATGNLPEILPYTVPGNVKEMSKFPEVGNVHTMNRKCELSCTFHGISWPRKFRISSSDSVFTAMMLHSIKVMLLYVFINNACNS